MSPAAIDRWLSAPQAVFLLATGDLARACKLTEADPELLVYRVARALSSKHVIVPLHPAASEAERVEAWQTAKKSLAANAQDIDLYSAAVSALVDVLSVGRARALGSRKADGPIEPIDPVEFTRVRIFHLDAVNERTKEVVWYDVRVSSKDLLELRQWVKAEASTPARKQGRASAPFWTDARAEVKTWLEDYGCPAPNDGNQAKLERHISDWLSERGHNPGEATIRRYVGKWIQEFRTSSRP
jgi:hypothetical protein